MHPVSKKIETLASLQFTWAPLDSFKFYISSYILK